MKRVAGRLAISCAMLAGLFWAPPAAADDSDALRVVICHPGGPGSTEEAAPRLATFSARVEELAGWPEGHMQGIYLNTSDACELQLRTRKPHVAILSLDTYLAHGAELKALPLLEVLPLSGERERYHLVGSAEETEALDDLKGKTIAGETLTDPKFLSRLVFAGRLDAAEDLALERTRTALRALRLVQRGKAAAALVDSNTAKELKTLPFGDSLHTIFVSEALPGWPVLALGDSRAGDRLSESRQRALIEALTQVCQGEAGARYCEPAFLGGFVPITPATYAEVRERYSGD